MSEACGQTYGSGDKLYGSLPHIHAHQRTSIAEQTLKTLRTKITHPVGKPDFVLSHPRASTMGS